jgi:hypothetical protein
MAMSSGGHLRVRPVDPRDTAWEVNAPAYRVYFWLQPPGPPPSGEEQMAWISDEYEVEDADVAVVLEWANSKASPGPDLHVVRAGPLQRHARPRPARWYRPNGTEP